MSAMTVLPAATSLDDDQGMGHPRSGRATTRAVQLGAGQSSELRKVRMTALALAAFVEYRDMGAGRSLRAVYERSKGRADPRKRFRLATLETWSRRYGWGELVRTYDENVAVESAQRTLERRVREAERRRDERMTIATYARAVGVDGLKELAKAPGALSPTAIVGLLRFADDTELRDSGDDRLPPEKLEATPASAAGISQEKLEALYNQLPPEEQARLLEVLRHYEESYRLLSEFFAGA